MPVILINDFSGGLNTTDPEENLGPNQVYNVGNFLHDRGGLKSIEGRNTYSANGTTLNAINGTAAINSLARIYKTAHKCQGTTSTDQTKWLIARSGQWMWLDTSTVNTAGAAVSGRTPDWRPIIARSNISGEDAVTINGRIHLANAAVRPYIWDGFFYKVGQANITGTSIIGNGTDFTKAKSGDQCFFKKAGSWYYQSGKYIQGVTSATHASFNAVSGTNSGGNVDYIISRSYDAAVYSPQVQLTAATSAGSGIPTGTYKYTYSFYNSDTANEGNARSDADALSVAVSGTNHRVTIGTIAWSAFGAEADKARLYRTTGTAGTSSTYKRVTELSRSTTTGAFPQYVDSMSATTLATKTAAPSDHDVMPQVKNIIEFNGRLYGWGVTGNKERLYFSTLGSPEYWPSYEWGIDSPTDVTLGGYVTLSDPGDPIVAAIVEGGTYGSSGKIGSNLLVFTNTRAYRWYGNDWNDFYRVEALGIGCIAPKSLVNHGGMIIWLSHQGVVAMPAGANTVQNIGLPIRASIPDNITEPFMTYGAKACGVVWRDWYLLAWAGDTNTDNVFIVAFHLPSGTWTAVHEAPSTNYVNDFSVWDGTGDNGELYYADSSNSYIWRLFAKTGSNTYFTPSSSTGVTARFGKFLTLARSEEEIDWVKTIKRVSTCWARPASSQNVTLKIETNGAWPNVQSSPTFNKTVSVSSTDAGSTKRRRAYAEWYPNVSGRSFALEFNGTFTAQMQIIWIKVEYEIEDKAPGRTVG